MTRFATILTSAAGLAMFAGAAPAAAQYAPGYNQGGIGGVINQILGGGRYGAYGQGNDRVAVDQCARAAEAQMSRGYRPTGYNQGYSQQGYGYNQPGYNRPSTARVVGITGVERRQNGLKVSGVMDSGRYHQGAYGAPGYGAPGYGNQGYNPNYPNQGYPNQGYGNPYGNNAQVVADLRFSCRVDYRGYVRDIDIKRNVASRRGY